AMANVHQVVIDPLMKIAGASLIAANLPQPRYPRWNRQARPAPGDADLVFLKRRRARPHEAHVSKEDVGRLWQPVEIRRAQEATHARHPRIVAQLELRSIHLVLLRQCNLLGMCACNHGAEFPAWKMPAPFAFAMVRKEHRAA